MFSCEREFVKQSLSITDKESMLPVVDLTLYHQIKGRFSAEPGTIIFISLTSENVDDLVAQSFDSVSDEYNKILFGHYNDSKPYAIFERLHDEYNYYFWSKEYFRGEDIASGRITYFRAEPMKKSDFRHEEVRKELAQLAQLLRGDSQAS